MLSRASFAASDTLVSRSLKRRSMAPSAFGTRSGGAFVTAVSSVTVVTTSLRFSSSTSVSPASTGMGGRIGLRVFVR